MGESEEGWVGKGGAGEGWFGEGGWGRVMRGWGIIGERGDGHNGSERGGV